MLKPTGRGLHVRIATGNSHMITMAAYIIYFKHYNYAKHLILSNYIRPKTKIHEKDFFGLSYYKFAT